ncbi:undecaprenyl-phosphate glucose phosphotransferase [bacterium]|nr:undecaprenyl-phosphate glucose phosphotransferase [bacterium]
MKNRGIARPFRSQLDILQRVIDGLIVCFSLELSYWIYYGTRDWSDKYTISALAAIPIFYMSAKANNLYHAYLTQGSNREIRSLFLAWFGTLAGLLILGYALKSTHELSRVTLGVYSILTPILLLGSRGVTRLVLSEMRSRGVSTRRALIVGMTGSGLSLADNIRKSPFMGLQLLGFVVLSGEEVAKNRTILGSVKDLETITKLEKPDVVYIAVPVSERDAVDGILRVLGDSTVSIFVVPDIYTADIMQGEWVTVGDTPTVSVIDAPSRGINSLVKRSEDVVVASIALLLLGLPMLIIALLIRMTSAGPAIYKQARYGVSGKPITVLKFRTMTVMESSELFVQATQNDSRVTSLGRFLRKTSLDELPQFLNVLRGDMSIVGPRPHPVALNEEYRPRILGYMLRHKVKPGITGLAQVNGYRGETDTSLKMEHRVRYDIEYINNWSLWLDIAIILRTPFSIIKNKDVY